MVFFFLASIFFQATDTNCGLFCLTTSLHPGSYLPLLFPQRGQQMTHVFIALLLLVSGVYYPVNVLPGILQKIAIFSPATYILAGVRQALLDGASLGQFWSSIWPVLIMGLVLIPAGLKVFNLAEVYAKRTGKLHRNE